MGLQIKMFCPVANIDGRESLVLTGMKSSRADARRLINKMKKESPGLFNGARVAEVLISEIIKDK